MAFNFPLMPRLFMAIRREDQRPIIDIMNQMPEIPPACQWALFLRNHDELTLEMVTDDERDYMYTEYARDPRMRLNLGIRRRLAPLMDNGRRQIELMHSLLFTLPGSPVLYYGDEIGMGDNIHLGDRRGVRTPMQWTGDRNAGFSRANPSALYQPIILDPIYHYQAVNVEAQLAVADVAAELAAAADPGAARAQGLRPGQPRIHPLPQSPRRRLRPRVSRPDRTRRQQPVAILSAGRARPEPLQGNGPHRDRRQRSVSHDRRAPVPDHAGPARLLLVPPGEEDVGEAA